MTIDAFIAGFTEEPGYLDYGRFGPLSTPAAEESFALTQVLQRARHASVDVFLEQDARVRAAASALTGFPAEPVVFQPNTSQGIMHAMFGLTGSVLLSPGEFPSLPIAAVRAAGGAARRAARVARDRPRQGDARPDPRAARVERGRRGREPRRLAHRLPLRHRGHPAGDRRPAAHRRRHPGLRRRRRPVGGGRRRALGRAEVVPRRMGHRHHGAVGAGPRAPDARLLGLHRHRGARAVGRGAAARPRRARLPGVQPRPDRRGAPRGRAGGPHARSASPRSTRRSPSGSAR